MWSVRSKAFGKSRRKLGNNRVNPLVSKHSFNWIKREEVPPQLTKVQSVKKRHPTPNVFVKVEKEEPAPQADLQEPHLLALREMVSEKIRPLLDAQQFVENRLLRPELLTVLEERMLRSRAVMIQEQIAESNFELARRETILSDLSGTEKGLLACDMSETTQIEHQQKMHDLEAAKNIVSSGACIAPAMPSTVASNAFEFDRCIRCNSTMRNLTSECILVCQDCGLKSECPDPGSLGGAVTYYNFDRRASLLTHRRLIKVREYLKQVTAKQKSVVPVQVVLDILTRAAKRYPNMSSCNQITFRQVRDTIVDLDMRNFLDYTTQIYCNICKCSPPKISPQVEETILVMIATIQEPFDDFKNKATSTFFSLPYLTLTVCRFLGLSELAKYILLVKTRTRIQTQEALLMKIFERLKWTPFPKLTEDDIFGIR